MIYLANTEDVQYIYIPKEIEITEEIDDEDE